MTTAAIEKLRGLLERWRNEADKLAEFEKRWLSREVTVEDSDEMLVAQGAYQQQRIDANELEAAGLPELLADYERLLRAAPQQPVVSEYHKGYIDGLECAAQIAEGKR